MSLDITNLDLFLTVALCVALINDCHMPHPDQLLHVKSSYPEHA